MSPVTGTIEPERSSWKPSIRALEADRRVSAAIAASLWAAEDVRLQLSLQPAA